MRESAAELAEVQFVRERFKEMLTELEFALIVETDTAHDGWRGEFIGVVDEVDVVLLTHKDRQASFATLCLPIPVVRFDVKKDCPKLMDQASDYDLSAYLTDGRSDVINLASRVLISGTNRADFNFTLSNLLFCREEILAVFGEQDDV